MVQDSNFGIITTLVVWKLEVHNGLLADKYSRKDPRTLSRYFQAVSVNC